MFEVIWLSDALHDLEKHFDFLNEKNPDAASRAAKAILSSAASLAKSPQRGVAIQGQNQRKLRVFFGKYGYLIYYRVEENRVFILRVHHGRSNDKRCWKGMSYLSDRELKPKHSNRRSFRLDLLQTLEAIADYEPS